MNEQQQLKTKVQLKEPSSYKVILLNDDFTPMDFVVDLLEQVFHKNAKEASQIMLEVHERGSGLCGIYTCEVAETKINQTHERARNENHPLQCRMEEV